MSDSYVSFGPPGRMMKRKHIQDYRFIIACSFFFAKLGWAKMQGNLISHRSNVARASQPTLLDSGLVSEYGTGSSPE